MKFKFAKDLPYQIAAVDAVVDVSLDSVDGTVVQYSWQRLAAQVKS